jgi:hypothetical protein
MMPGSGWIRSSFRSARSLEAKRVGRGNYVLFQESGSEATGGPVKVSRDRWTRFLAAIKTGRFEPQREGTSVTICIGDLPDEDVSRRGFVETTAESYAAFAKGVMAGEFDRL